ncbi:MAG: signal peptidase I [Anaerolineae bacterium]
MEPHRPQTDMTPEPIQASAPSWFARALREVLETVIPAVVIALVIQLFLAQATRVYGQSMEPNLHTDQRLVVEKISYRLHFPQRGDIVVIRVPGHSRELLIKRVIALPGETVEIRDGVVYIDGEPLDEPYVIYRSHETLAPRTVPPLSVFVMGDNRSASNDSRVFGPIHRDNIVGRAWISYWPPSLIGWVE